VTDVPPPDSPKPPRGRPRRPKGFDDVPELSDEEVARRVDVRGGGAPRAPIERAPVRDRRPAARQERTVARDSLLLIGLVIVGLVAVRLFLPDGPLTASASPTPAGSDVAVGSTATPGTPTSGPTGGLITLPPPPPTEFVPTASPGPVTAPPATQKPVPTPTLKPGQTPPPTPKPTKTPTPTATSGPTPPGTATVIVIMHVVNDNGGNDQASDWTMKITGEVGLGTSDNNFPGEESPGKSVTITAGLGYLVTDNVRIGYDLSPAPTAGCSRTAGSGGLAPGQTVFCTITRNDQPAKVNVTINVVGTDPGDIVLAVNANGASQSTVSSTGPTPVTMDSNSSWSVTYDSGASGYDYGSSGTCSSGGLNEGQAVSCTYTFTEPAPTVVSGSVVWLPIAAAPLLPLLRRRRDPRRWRSTRAG
jgi:hypothetical protein